jgi:hypothetical protein
MLFRFSAFLPPLSEASKKKLTASFAVDPLLVTRYHPFTLILLGMYSVSVWLLATYTPSGTSSLHPDNMSPNTCMPGTTDREPERS